MRSNRDRRRRHRGRIHFADHGVHVRFGQTRAHRQREQLVAIAIGIDQRPRHDAARARGDLSMDGYRIMNARADAF